MDLTLSPQEQAFRDELRGWLEELIFTARETLREMEGPDV